MRGHHCYVVAIIQNASIRRFFLPFSVDSPSETINLEEKNDVVIFFKMADRRPVAIRWSGASLRRLNLFHVLGENRDFVELRKRANFLRGSAEWDSAAFCLELRPGNEKRLTKTDVDESIGSPG